MVRWGYVPPCPASGFFLLCVYLPAQVLLWACPCGASSQHVSHMVQSILLGQGDLSGSVNEPTVSTSPALGFICSLGMGLNCSCLNGVHFTNRVLFSALVMVSTLEEEFVGVALHGDVVLIPFGRWRTRFLIPTFSWQPGSQSVFLPGCPGKDTIPSLKLPFG